MGVLQRFERRLEGAVGTAFARLFKGQVEPVEVAKALQREAEARRAIVGQDRVLVPNRYVVELGPTDHDRLAPWETQLTNTLAEMVQEHVDDEGWSTFGDIEVSLSRNEELGTGMFNVTSSVDPNAGPRRRPYNSLSMPAVPAGGPAPAGAGGAGGVVPGFAASSGYGGGYAGDEGVTAPTRGTAAVTRVTGSPTPATASPTRGTAGPVTATTATASPAAVGTASPAATATSTSAATSTRGPTTATSRPTATGRRPRCRRRRTSSSSGCGTC